MYVDQAYLTVDLKTSTVLENSHTVTTVEQWIKEPPPLQSYFQQLTINNS